MYAICPLDNRYYNKISPISNYFSYKSWIEFRVYVELKYFSLLYNILSELHNNISTTKILEFSLVIGSSFCIHCQFLVQVEKNNLSNIE